MLFRSRRRMLLALLLDEFSIRVSGVDETGFLVDASPGAVENAALAKARDVARCCGTDALIIAADTVISFRGRLLGKPSGREEAAAMLRELKGAEHQVITGAAILVREPRAEFCFHESTAVRMNDYSEREIRDYAASGEPLDKAGAYAIQGLGGKMVHSIRGCYPNVVGFPLCAVARRLNLLGIRTRPVPEICPARLSIVNY